jgi:N-acetylmuramoyl-L-alanine amidase
VPPAPLDDGDPGLDEDGAAIAETQTLLAAYGYGVETNGIFDETTKSVVRAFQLHFRPGRVDGRLDRSTADTLARLVAALPLA